ncbi:MAG: hypothetical protein J5701_04390 [Bacteroidales bacterium]|nr:hypothetical protein [Bacteroidales bacterium]
MIRIGKIVIIGFIILSSTCGFAQIDREENVFYKYHKGEKLYLFPNYSHIVVPSKNITQINSYLGENIVIKKINDQKSIIELLSNNVNEASLNNVLMKLDSLSENSMKIFYIFGKDSMFTKRGCLQIML